MRVTKAQAGHNREKIVTAAARMFRQGGVAATGVDAVAQSVGLTYGSLYSHFGSKAALVAEAVDQAFRMSDAKLAGVTDVAEYVASYLSPRHRDDPGSGCAIAALGCEIPRQALVVRRSFTVSLKRRVAAFAALLPQRQARHREKEALGMLATMAGALLLARAVDDPELSQDILTICREYSTRCLTN